MERNSRCSVDAAFDLTAMLHPAQAFAKPMDVVHDLDLTLPKNARSWRA